MHIWGQNRETDSVHAVAVCQWCQQDMHDRVGCTLEVYRDFNDGIVRRRIPYGGEPPPYAEDQVCHDCLVPQGRLHHPGCDMEACPRCEGQAMTCGCADPESKGSEPPPADSEVLRQVDGGSE